MTDVSGSSLPFWEEGSWGWRETLWYIPQSLQQLQRGWDKTTWLPLRHPSWESIHAASPPVCPARCRDERQIGVNHQQQSFSTQSDETLNWTYGPNPKEAVLLFFQAALLAALLVFLLFITVIIRAVEVRIERRWAPQRAIFKHPKVVCSPFGWRFTLSRHTTHYSGYDDKLTGPWFLNIFVQCEPDTTEGLRPCGTFYRNQTWSME